MNDEQGRRRGNRTAALDDGEVAACPECDDSSVEMGNLGDSMGPRTDTARYFCSHCYAHFDTFVIRERKRDTSPGGLPGDLLDADPDEVSRD